MASLDLVSQRVKSSDLTWRPCVDTFAGKKAKAGNRLGGESNGHGLIVPVLPTPYSRRRWSRESKSRARMPLESFRQFAAEGRLTPSEMVMNGAEQRWMSASAVPGLSFPSPPQMGPAAPQATPAAQALARTASVASAGNSDLARHSQWNRLREIACWQRSIHAALLPYALLYYFVAGPGPAAVLLCNSAAIGLAWVSAKQAAALNLTPWLFGGLMFVPCVSALGWLFLMQRATRALKEAGIRVGLFGARLDATPPESFAPAG
jgi:hypothetical protein